MMSGAKYRLQCLGLDIGFRPWFIRPAAAAVTLLATLLRPFDRSRALWLLTVAHRIAARGWTVPRQPGEAKRIRRLTAAIAASLEKAEALPPVGFNGTPLDCQSADTAGIVLKAPIRKDGGVEKGVILLKYSHRIAAFQRAVNMYALLEHYRIVLEPSWTGYSHLAYLSFTRYREHPIVILAPFQGDREFIDAIGQNLIAIELGPGDWVDPSVFRPLPSEPKRYDAVFVARWNHVKRHDLLLRAMRRLGDARFRVALAALNTRLDRGREAILRSIRAHGMGGQFDILEDLPAAEVNRVLNQAKVNVLLSRQEGGNRGIFEGFFAGVPGLVMRGHIGVRTEHIVPETGRLFDLPSLASELFYFRDHWEEFAPRPWALDHIAPAVSAARLNEVLRGLALREGEPWTVDIVAKANRPGVGYYPGPEEGRGLPSIDGIVREYGRERVGRGR